MADTTWNSLYCDTLLPWLTGHSDSVFFKRHFQDDPHKAGGVLIFINVHDEFLTVPPLELAVFQKYLSDRLNVPAQQLSELFNASGVTVHNPDEVNLRGFQVILESLNRMPPQSTESAPSQLLFQSVRSRKEAASLFSSFKKKLDSRSVTSDAPQPGLSRLCSAVFFDFSEALLMTTAPDAYFHRVFEVAPLLRRKPAPTAHRHAL